MSRGILIVSHVAEIGDGLKRLIEEVAKDVPITVAAGTSDGEVGTEFDKVSQAIEENAGKELFAFYDLGSAKMNLEMAVEMTDKSVQIYNTALVEGCYNAAALIQAGVETPEIEQTLETLVLEK